MDVMSPSASSRRTKYVGSDEVEERVDVDTGLKDTRNTFMMDVAGVSTSGTWRRRLVGDLVEGLGLLDVAAAEVVGGIEGAGEGARLGADAALAAAGVGAAAAGVGAASAEVGAGEGEGDLGGLGGVTATLVGSFVLVVGSFVLVVAVAAEAVVGTVALTAPSDCLTFWAWNLASRRAINWREAGETQITTSDTEEGIRGDPRQT